MDYHHRDNYCINLEVFNILPPTHLSCEVMKVPFSSGDRIVFAKNDKDNVSELGKQPNELKVEFRALILVSELLTLSSVRERFDERWNFRFE